MDPLPVILAATTLSTAPAIVSVVRKFLDARHVAGRSAVTLTLDAGKRPLRLEGVPSEEQAILIANWLKEFEQADGGDDSSR